MKKEKGNTTGASLMGLLGVLFVGLKLTGHIAWSWWWVTLPFWGGAALALAITLLILTAAGGTIALAAKNVKK